MTSIIIDIKREIDDKEFDYIWKELTRKLEVWFDDFSIYKEE